MPLGSTTSGRTAEQDRPARSPVRSARGPDSDASRHRTRSVAKQLKAAERIAAEISAQNAESVEVSRQLTGSMREIAAGAEQASGATRRSLATMNQIGERVGRQEQSTRRVAELSRTLRDLLNETCDGVDDLLAGVDGVAARQTSSVVTITELERQADEIGEIVATVAYIADQASLLALNAEIETARTRRHGKGFAVVAEEVRVLAETGERSAGRIRDLIDEMRGSVTEIAGAVRTSAETARGEVVGGRTIMSRLESLRAGLDAVVAGAEEMSTAAQQAQRAAGPAGQRSEEIAADAGRQSAACEESLRTAGRQNQALRRGEQAAEALAEVCETLRGGGVAGRAGEAASAAEELSAAVAEICRATTQVGVAINEIGSGARTVAEKSQRAVEAITVAEQDARLSQRLGSVAVERSDAILELLATNRAAVGSMIGAIRAAGRDGVENVRRVTELERISRRLDKIVGAVTGVSIRTGMLAVSGSVESVRAGESGKGFAVVSAGLRDLARDSADSADRIEDLVKAVQDRIVEVRRELEETCRMSLAEVEPAQAVSARLEEIERGMQQVRGGNAEVRESAERIATMLGEVKTGLEQITSAADQTEQMAVRSSAVAKGQAQGAEDLAAMVEEIIALGDELRNAG